MFLTKLFARKNNFLDEFPPIICYILEDAAKLIKSDGKVLSKVELFEALFYRYRAVFHWVIHSMQDETTASSFTRRSSRISTASSGTVASSGSNDSDTLFASNSKSDANMALARVINKRHITHAILNRYVRVPKFTIPADLLNDLKAISAAPNPLVPLFELVLTDRNVGVLLEASGIDSAELLSNILRQTSTLSFLYDHDSLAPGESKYIKDEYIKLALAQRPRSSRSQVHGKAITDIITSLKDSRLLNPVISCHVNTTRAILVSAIHTMLFEGQIDQLPTHILILNLRKCYKSKSTDRCQRSFKPIYDFIRAKPSTVLFIKEFEKLLTVLDLDKECIARQIKFDIEFGALNCIGFMKFSSKEDGDMLIQKQRRRKVYKHYYVDAANLLTSFSSFKYGAIGNYV